MLKELLERRKNFKRPITVKHCKAFANELYMFTRDIGALPTSETKTPVQSLLVILSIMSRVERRYFTEVVLQSYDLENEMEFHKVIDSYKEILDEHFKVLRKKYKLNRVNGFQVVRFSVNKNGRITQRHSEFEITLNVDQIFNYLI